MDFIDVKETGKNTTTTTAETTNIAVVNDNTIVDETLESATSAATSSDVDASQQVNILDVPIENENVALNVLVSFINLGQRRGVFNVQESAKIWECVQVFKKASGAM